MAAIATNLLRAVPLRLRRPTGLVEQTRWLFLLFLFGEMAIVLPVPLQESLPSRVVLGIVCTAALVTSWIYRYLRQSNAWVLDVVDSLGVLGFGLSSTRPSIAIGIVMSALWFRAMYGTFPRLILYCVGTAGALAAPFPLWHLLWTEHTPPAEYSLGPIPITFLVAVVCRHLALNLLAREQGQNRDIALGHLGTRLLLVTDRASIRGFARECAQELCAATPAMGIVLADETPDGLAVSLVAGSCGAIAVTLPPTLPASLAGETDAITVPVRLTEAGPLDATGTAWWRLALPEQPGRWMFFTLANDKRGDAERAIVSMVSQVALALRNSESHDHLAIQASTDALTGLANRLAFGTALDVALRSTTRGSRPAVIFLDLDDFKTVNDTLGHACGDELLQLVSQRLRDAVRSADLCARLGGDEFAVLLPDASDYIATTVAQRLVDVVAAPAELRGHPVAVGASVGLVFVEAGQTAEQLVQHADIAMYAAKAKGKNRMQTFEWDLLGTGSPSYHHAVQSP